MFGFMPFSVLFVLKWRSVYFVCDVVSSLDPDGSRYVFEGCPCEVVRSYRYDGCDPWVDHSKDDWRNGDDDVEDQWADHYSNSLNWYISEHDRGR